MAKLGAYYGLCPIIDQKSVLGIQEDAQTENVLVTLGKNIAIKYKISDQKQLISWRTKDKFTSPVMYCKDNEKYCAIFNQTQLKYWTSEDENLDKMKKYKFNKQIYTILQCGDHLYLIFQNGAIYPLKEAFDNRKELNPPDVKCHSEKIIDVLHMNCKDKQYIGLICMQDDEKCKFLYTVFVGQKQINFKQVDLQSEFMSGYTLMKDLTDDVIFLTLDHEGKMYSHPLKINNHDVVTNTFFALVENLSCKNKVSMIALNEDYLALYGADSNEEGAVLLIYNTQFKVTQCQQSLKLFTSGTKLWSLNDLIFLCVGQNIAIVPYDLNTEQLAALIGSHKTLSNDSDVSIVQDLVVVSWDDKAYATKSSKFSGNVKKELDKCMMMGWSESSICDELIPKYLENNDLDAIKQTIAYFCDVPELYIVKLLDYFMDADESLFDKDDSFEYKLPPNLEPMQRCQMIDQLLLLKFSDVILLPYLRSQMSFTNTLILLRYICYLLSEDSHSIHKDVAFSEQILIQWGSVLLDANYQRIVLSKDEKIVEILNYFRSLVNAQLFCLEELQHVEPVLQKVKNKGVSSVWSSYASLQYSIEKLKLY